MELGLLRNNDCRTFEVCFYLPEALFYSVRTWFQFKDDDPTSNLMFIPLQSYDHLFKSHKNPSVYSPLGYKLLLGRLTHRISLLI